MELGQEIQSVDELLDTIDNLEKTTNILFL